MVICNIISYRNKHNKVTYQQCYYDPDGLSRWRIPMADPDGLSRWLIPMADPDGLYC